MNQHLNVFNPYTKVNRDTNELENDLTRALALTLLENNLFLYTFLKEILSSDVYDKIMGETQDYGKLDLSIQKQVSKIEDFEHLYAVGISETEINKDHLFFEQTFDKNYEPITDMFISIGNYAIIIEVKPNATDCTAQLYNQVYNIYDQVPTKDMVTVVDYNWQKLIIDAISINNFQKITQKPSRFLENFIDFIRKHNYRWLPEIPLNELLFSTENIKPITDRLNTIVSQFENNVLNKKRRIGFICDQPWADEVLILLEPNFGQVIFSIYPGNTKGQGWHIFKNPGEPRFKSKLTIKETTYDVEKIYHIKFSSFQKYFTGLYFKEKDLNESLYNRENFKNYSGRRKKESGDWDKLAHLFDQVFKENYDWKTKVGWDDKKFSRKTQFDVSFGYAISINVPYENISTLDTDKENIEEVGQFLQDMAIALENVFPEEENEMEKTGLENTN